MNIDKFVVKSTKSKVPIIRKLEVFDIVAENIQNVSKTFPIDLLR